DVSLASGCQVAAALREAGHAVTAFDTVTGALTPADERRILETGVGLEPPGEAVEDLFARGDTGALADDPAVRGADVLFLALHGGIGEDGTVQAMLDLVGRPYTGSGMVGAALAMDKELSKRLLRDAS